MNIANILRAFIAIFIVALLATCGGAASGPVSPSSMPVAIEGLDGASGIDTGSSFTYTFNEEIDPSTVTSGNFFIVQAVTADISAPRFSISANADVTATPISATITFGLVRGKIMQATLTPAQALNPGVSYTIYILTDPPITTPDGRPVLVAPVIVEFMTKVSTSRSVSSIKVNGSASDLNDMPINSPILITFSGQEAPLSDVESLVSVVSQGRDLEPSTVLGTWQAVDVNGAAVSATSSLYFLFTPATAYSYCDRVVVILPETLVETATSTSFTTLYSYASPFSTSNDLQQNFATCWASSGSGTLNGTLSDTTIANGGNGLNFRTTDGENTDPSYNLDHFPMLDLDNATFTALVDGFSISGAGEGGPSFLMAFMASQEDMTPVAMVTFEVVGDGSAGNGNCLIFLSANDSITNPYSGTGVANECLLTPGEPMSLRYELIGTTLNMYAANSCTTDCSFSAGAFHSIALPQYGYYTLSVQPYFRVSDDDPDAFLTFDIVSISFTQ